MSTDPAAPRSRRALLRAAAAAGGAIVASAALPMAASAHDPDDVQMSVDNATTATTSITDPAADSTAFSGNATGTGSGYGVLGTSTGGGGVVGWSVSPPDASWFVPEYTAYTGVFGSSPENPDPDVLGAGVWGDSPDVGVYGSGGLGVYGYGGIGVEGDANSLAGSVGVWAWAPTTSQYALRATGKVNFSRSGRVAIASGASGKSVTLAGTTATSKVFAVLSTSETGRWVRAVVPASGKFTIYLNTALTSSAVASWFVLD